LFHGAAVRFVKYSPCARKANRTLGTALGKHGGTVARDGQNRDISGEFAHFEEWNQEKRKEDRTTVLGTTQKLLFSRELFTVEWNLICKIVTGVHQSFRIGR
jgi:hypothetical protein